MMKRFSLSSGIGACIGMLILILDSRTALAGARTGVQLAVETVIPSLFPFFFLSILLSGSAGTEVFPLLRPLGKMLRIPKGTEGLLLPAFLGGYPAGAQATATAWKNGKLDQETAERMLAFCSNAGPSFLFGIVAAMFPEVWMAWALWLIHISGALYAALLLPVSPSAGVASAKARTCTVSDALTGAINAMANVCGWVILFRVLITFLEVWVLWLIPPWGQTLAAGLLELTNGCCGLWEISDIRLRFVICSMMLSLGGICIVMQTKSVVRGLSLRWYYAGKLLQTVFSIAASIALIYESLLPCLILTLPPVYLLRKNQKRSSIPLPSGV